MYPTLESRGDILKMLDELTQARKQILEQCGKLTAAQLADPVYSGTWSVLQNLSPDFKYQPGLVVADGDYVMVHGRYVGWGPKPMVGVDIFRVANGKIAEHWDVLQEEVPATQSANGNGMFTGPQV